MLVDDNNCTSLNKHDLGKLEEIDNIWLVADVFELSMVVCTWVEILCSSYHYESYIFTHIHIMA